jgi:hypothetical protein
VDADPPDNMVRDFVLTRKGSVGFVFQEASPQLLDNGWCDEAPFALAAFEAHVLFCPEVIVVWVEAVR